MKSENNHNKNKEVGNLPWISIFKHSSSISTANEEMYLELSGSPYRMTKQKSGVLFATNGCGPAYQALTDIVYGSEFERYANFSYDVRCGTVYGTFV